MVFNGFVFLKQALSLAVLCMLPNPQFQKRDNLNFINYLDRLDETFDRKRNESNNRENYKFLMVLNILFFSCGQ